MRGSEFNTLKCESFVQSATKFLTFFKYCFLFVDSHNRLQGNIMLFYRCSKRERTERKKHMNIKEVANAMDNVVFEAKDELSKASILGNQAVINNLIYYYHNVDSVADEVAKNLHLNEDEYESFYIQFENEHKTLMSWLDLICKMYQ